jgi:hypothetical protein
MQHWNEVRVREKSKMSKINVNVLRRGISLVKGSLMHGLHLFMYRFTFVVLLNIYNVVSNINKS